MNTQNYIRKKRQELNLTQRELAKLLRVHTRTVQNWEAGVHTASIEVFSKLEGMKQ